MKNIQIYTIVLMLTLLSACSEPYEGTFVGSEPGGKEFKIKVTDNQILIADVKINYVIIETKNLDDGPAYVFQLFDPDKPKEVLGDYIITMQMVDSNTMQYGVSHYGLIVTGEYNTMQLKRK